MSGAAITFDGSDAIGKINSLAALLLSRRVLDIAGEAVLSETLDAFRNGADPATGAPWAPLTMNTRASRRKGASAKALLDTGVLRASFGRGAVGNIWRESPGSLKVGSAHKLAVWHQLGTGEAAGKGKYPIVPKKPGGFLRFRVANDAARSGRSWAFARLVLHPGVPARPMLGVSPKAAERIAALMRTEVDRSLAHAEGKTV